MKFYRILDLTEELLSLIRNGDNINVLSVASIAGRLKQIKSNELRKEYPLMTMN